jgi:putative FmdB family regulatory protein
MPIFEYKCQDCSTRFEELVLNSKQAEPDCPECGGAGVERLISTFSRSLRRRYAALAACPALALSTEYWWEYRSSQSMS